MAEISQRESFFLPTKWTFVCPKNMTKYTFDYENFRIESAYKLQVWRRNE